MKTTITSVSGPLASLTVVTGMSALLSSCNLSNSQESQVIKIDGSSSVYPVTKEPVNEFSFVKNKKHFVEFYINKSPELVSTVGYVPLTDESYKLH
ncbi:MAG: hypothetical protein HRU34_00265 [Richelia sp.]|nr:hypothetical protein [Richelia sp.]